MMLPQLTYPVQQPYRIRWITEIFYAASVILIALLAVLNLALVGYDSITVLTSNPNVTHYNQWWAPEGLPDALKIRTTPGECQPITLPINSPLRTNSSLPMFSYTLKSDFNLPNEGTQAGLSSETTYRANPLNDCRVQTMIFTANLRMLSFEISTTVQCDHLGEAQQLRAFTMSFSRATDYVISPDTILDYLRYQAPRAATLANVQRLGRLSIYGPPQDTFLNILGVLDGLGSDVVYALMIQYELWRFRLPTVPVPEIGYLIWDSLEDERGPLDPTRILDSTVYSNSYWYVGGYVSDINATVINMLISLRDAIHLDLGHAAPANVYLNKTSFNRMISPDDYLVKSLPDVFNSGLIATTSSICSWAWGCSPNFNTTWAQTLISSDEPFNNLTLPVSPPSPIYPSVINLAYLCPQYQRKSWGSLFISVFVGTFTMYGTMYGVFSWIGPKLDRRLADPRPQTLSKNDEAERRSLELTLVKSTPSTPSFFSKHPLPETAEEHLLHDYDRRGITSE